MASVTQLKRRIQAAQNVSKTTRAMQMIAASKLKRAQDTAVASKPYVDKLTILVQGLAAKVDENTTHPYLKMNTDTNKTLLIVLSPDKGLCGGLITNLMREFFKFTDAQKDVIFLTMGKKIEVSVAHLNKEIIASFPFGTKTPDYEMVYPIVSLIDEYYLNKHVSSVKILSTQFVSIFNQSPKITSLLPISLGSQGQTSFNLFEPALAEMLPYLMKHYLEITIYQHLLENFVSEQGSRMIAMQNATNNAKDIIEDLRLEYNKSRQAKITSEILDITGGSTASQYEE